MSNNITHFAIHADDCERAKEFYQKVFGWSFQPWGPPDFWLITTSADAIHGSLQMRREPVSGTGLIGFECTIGVDDIRSTIAAIEAAGGRIIFPPFMIDGVGTVAQFEDPENNRVSVMQYLKAA